MASVYANLITKKKKTIDDVPTKDPNLKNEVIAVLRQYVVEGKITKEDFESYAREPYDKIEVSE